MGLSQWKCSFLVFATVLWHQEPARARCSQRDRDLSATTQRGKRRREEGPHQPGPQPMGSEEDKQDRPGYGINRVQIGGQVNSNGIDLGST